MEAREKQRPRMRGRSAIALAVVAVLLLLLVIACAPPQPGGNGNVSLPVTTPVLEPKPPEPPTEIWIPGPEQFVLGADTVAIGTVGQGSTPSGQGNSIYSYWTFNVEEYVLKPLPENVLTIRILESDRGMPVKGVHLREGEHLLVFLNRNVDYFEFTGGIVAPGKFTVDDGSIQYSFYGDSPREPLDAAIAAIKAVADTWSGETLTQERRAQIEGIALDDPSVKEFLLGKQYEVAEPRPYLFGFVPGEIRYLLSIYSPDQQHWETNLVIIVNVTWNKVDKLSLNLSSAGFTEEDRDETLKIALAEPAVQQVIRDRGYEVFLITEDFWQETRDGKTLFHVYPMVNLFLYPRGSENLEIFVDLEHKNVVKIFLDSMLSPDPLESTGVERDFTLTISIPKTEYRVGETAEAALTLKYTGSEPVDISSPGGQYFNLFIRDIQNNMLYRWRDEKYPPGSLAGVLPTVTETIQPGWSVSGRLEFRVTEAGTLYLKGLTFNDSLGYQVLVTQGSGGYGVNVDTPFIVIQAR